MKPPTYYSKRLSELENEYEQYRDTVDYSGALLTTKSINKLKKDLQKMLNKEDIYNDEATSTQRFNDAEKQYSEYYFANWFLFFAMIGMSGAYFRRNSI